MAKINKATIIEAVLRINIEMLKKVPKTHTADFIKGYQKAAFIAHDVLICMMKEAKR